MSRDTGLIYEAIANQYLQKQGLVLIETNFQGKTGEIDLIMKDQDKLFKPAQEVLVFVEVRFRQSGDFCLTEDTINHAKQQRLIRTAKLYLQKKNLFDKIACRFDVIAIHGEKPQDEQILWIKNAFEAA